MSFRLFQALSDLRAAALHLLAGLNRDLTPKDDSLHAAFEAVHAARVPDWNLHLDDYTWSTLVVASCSPQDGIDAFLCATCALLFDRHANPNRGGDFEWEREAFSHLWRAAPAPIRAAIFNGLRSGLLGWTSETVAVDDCRTDQAHAVIAPLLTLARTLTPVERDSIAASDYGSDTDKHRTALDAVLASPDGRFPDYWYPAEVVELTAHVPHSPGFVGATALVLANAIYTDDHVNHAQFRWEQHSLTYLRLPEHQRIPLLRAFRHLYETSPDWDPFWERVEPERIPSDNFLPWDPPVAR